MEKKKVKIIKPTLPKGTRDFLPAQMLKREKVLNLIKSVFERYGYDPLETPAFENLEVLSGKYGEEGERLIFKILKRGEELIAGGRALDKKLENLLGELRIEKIVGKEDYAKILSDLALRYDLTVPLCRVIAMYPNEIKLPFKRYQIQPVWRADRPQKGRYREFYQCDVDIVGTSSILADFEILQITNEILKLLGFSKFLIKINNRKILSAMVEYCGIEPARGNEISVILDKLEKVGKEGVKKELKEKRIPEKVIEKLLPVLEIQGENQQILDKLKNYLKDSKIGTEGIKETEELYAYLDKSEIPKENYKLDLFLARGLEYYTGPIFESVVEKPPIGSLTGGGRYDKLIGIFLGRDIPATGTTIGIERIMDVMTELSLLPEVKTKTEVLVTIFNSETKPSSLQTVERLRSNGFKTEIYFSEKDGLRDQIGYANSKGIPVVVIIGPEEIKQNKIVIKNLKSGTQESVSPEELSDKVKTFLI